MIDSLYIIGKPGSGKSILIWYLSSLLTENQIPIKYISDRLELEKAVIKDTCAIIPDTDGVKVGKHSKLISDGPPGHKKVHVLDGFFLNQIHKQTLKAIAKKNKLFYLTLIEYAIGPDIDFGQNKHPLLQDTKHLVKWIFNYGILDKIFIIEVDAPLPLREYREIRRPDAMAIETFRAYFPDGGEMNKKDTKILGDHYYYFKNHDEDYDGYYSEARFLYETKIRPLIAQLR